MCSRWYTQLYCLPCPQPLQPVCKLQRMLCSLVTTASIMWLFCQKNNKRQLSCFCRLLLSLSDVFYMRQIADAQQSRTGTSMQCLVNLQSLCIPLHLVRSVTLSGFQLASCRASKSLKQSIKQEQCCNATAIAVSSMPGSKFSYSGKTLHKA